MVYTPLAHTRVSAPRSSAPAWLTPTWTRWLLMKCVCLQADIYYNLMQHHFWVVACKATCRTHFVPCLSCGSRFLKISQVFPAFSGFSREPIGVTSSLAPLPVLLLLAGAGSRCAGYLAGTQHPGGRRKQQLKLAAGRNVCEGVETRRWKGIKREPDFLDGAGLWNGAQRKAPPSASPSSTVTFC